MKYLSKHLTEAAYEAAASSLAKPHVALTADDNKVHYMPNATPSLSVVAVFSSDYEGDEEIELPYCIWSDHRLKIRFNRPIHYEELLSLKFETMGGDCNGNDIHVWNASINEDYIIWESNTEGCIIECHEFDGTSDTVELQARTDCNFKYVRLYFE